MAEQTPPPERKVLHVDIGDIDFDAPFEELTPLELSRLERTDPIRFAPLTILINC